MGYLVNGEALSEPVPFLAFLITRFSLRDLPEFLIKD
jgi:hypothetical protein